VIGARGDVQGAEDPELDRGGWGNGHLHSHGRRYQERLPAPRQVRSALVSLAGLIGRPVLNQAGQQIGRVAEVVARRGARCYPVIGRHRWNLLHDR
jgi:hypothetical protein